MILYNPNVDLVTDNVYTKFVYFLSIHSQGIEQNQILKSIKGHNFVVYLKKMTLYSPYADLFNVYLLTKYS